ncbi:MAG: hypothetical protein RIB59_15940 [Rhodospirillales bacterium]
MPTGKRKVSRKIPGTGIAVLTAAAIFAQVTPAYAMMCPSPAEQRALDVRVLQTHLMVAALSCDAKSSYNSFVNKFHAELVPHGYALRRLFKRTYGKSARHQLNRFITRLANDESASRITAGERYCPNAQMLFTRVLGAHNGYVGTLASNLPIAGSHGITACQPKQDDFKAAQRSQ